MTETIAERVPPDMTYTLNRCSSVFNRVGYELRLFDKGVPFARPVAVAGIRNPNGSCGCHSVRSALCCNSED
jgi:hypothetical protein